MVNKIFKNVVVFDNEDYLIRNTSELEDYIRNLNMKYEKTLK